MSESVDRNSAAGLVRRWLALNLEQFGIEYRDLEQFENSTMALAARCDVSGFLVDICVWDHAYCLDIMVCAQTSGALAYSAVGPCDDAMGVQERLASFAAWLSEI